VGYVLRFLQSQCTQLARIWFPEAWNSVCAVVKHLAETGAQGLADAIIDHRILLQYGSGGST
jgi:hypothetical protein